MWKYVTRRIRDTVERTYNVIDGRLTWANNGPGSAAGQFNGASSSPCYIKQYPLWCQVARDHDPRKKFCGSKEKQKKGDDDEPHFNQRTMWEALFWVRIYLNNIHIAWALNISNWFPIGSFPSISHNVYFSPIMCRASVALRNFTSAKRKTAVSIINYWTRPSSCMERFCRVLCSPLQINSWAARHRCASNRRTVSWAMTSSICIALLRSTMTLTKTSCWRMNVIPMEGLLPQPRWIPSHYFHIVIDGS